MMKILLIDNLIFKLIMPTHVLVLIDPDWAPRAFVRARAPWTWARHCSSRPHLVPFSFLYMYVAIQQSGSSYGYPLSRLKLVSSGVVRMFSDSLRTSSMALFARCKTFVSGPIKLIGWSFVHACSAMADLYVKVQDPLPIDKHRTSSTKSLLLSMIIYWPMHLLHALQYMHL